jgi:hypothetical protein
MRHDLLLPQAVTARPSGMGEAATAAALVAPTRLPHARTADNGGTIASTIDLTAIAVAADEDLAAAACTKKEADRGSHRRPPSRQRDIDRDHQLVEYSSPHPCPARCGARHRRNLAVLAGVVPVLLAVTFYRISALPVTSRPNQCPYRRSYLTARFTRISTAIHTRHRVARCVGLPRDICVDDDS